MKLVVLRALGPRDCWHSSALIPGDAAEDAEVALHKAQGCVGICCEPYVHRLLISGAGCTCQGCVGARL